ncbi:MAG TPA: PQQ-binding-like beta-propeller repeat protein, partial [Streptomyces sp.]
MGATGRLRKSRRGTRRRRGLALAVSTAVTLLGVGGLAPAQASETTGSVDNLRTGWDQSEPDLGPTDVRSSSFGQLWAAPAQLDGQVYAQPIVVGGTVIATTENNQVYGLNRATGAVIWQYDGGPAWPAATLNCGDLTPNVG